MKDIPTNTNPIISKAEFYQDLLLQVQALCEDQTYWVKKEKKKRERKYTPHLSK
jgi:hypothetical protein